MAPFLVIVSGLPAAGKTTLSTRLGHDLRVPVVHRDRLKRDVLGELAALPGAGELIPEAATQMTLAMLRSVLDAGGGVVLDGNFNTERHAAPVRELVRERGERAVEICLWGDPSALRRRFIARADPPLTADLEPYFEEVLHRPRDPVLAESQVLAHVDTTDLASLDAVYPLLLDRLSAVKLAEA